MGQSWVSLPKTLISGSWEHPNVVVPAYNIGMLCYTDETDLQHVATDHEADVFGDIGSEVHQDLSVAGKPSQSQHLGPEDLQQDKR